MNPVLLTLHHIAKKINPLVTTAPQTHQKLISNFTNILLDTVLLSINSKTQVYIVDIIKALSTHLQALFKKA